MPRPMVVDEIAFINANCQVYLTFNQSGRFLELAANIHPNKVVILVDKLDHDNLYMHYHQFERNTVD